MSVTGWARDNGTRRVPVDDRSSGCDRRSRPGWAHDRAGACLLQYSLHRVRSQCRSLDRDQGRHHADAHARDLAAVRRGSSVLAKAMRVDEIGDIERATNWSRDSVKLHLLRDETRFPFVINLPQHDMEPALRDCLAASKSGKVLYRHRLTSFVQHPDRVTLDVDTPDGNKTFEACYLLGCDGGRSTVRDRLGVTVEGRSLPERYSLVDLKVDLDVENPRDYPYLAYFSDAREWMILVRQPECWRFLYPVYEGQRSIRSTNCARRPCISSATSRTSKSWAPTCSRSTTASRSEAARPGAAARRRRPSDHADVGARAQYRNSRRQQRCLACGMGVARLGRRPSARRL